MSNLAAQIAALEPLDDTHPHAAQYLSNKRWRATNRSKGGRCTNVNLTPAACQALAWIQGTGEFETQSQAISAAVCYFKVKAKEENDMHGLTANEHELLDLMSTETGCEPSKILGLALRYLHQQVRSGADVTVG
jgi:hypothetical protein